MEIFSDLRLIGGAIAAVIMLLWLVLKGSGKLDIYLEKKDFDIKIKSINTKIKDIIDVRDTSVHEWQKEVKQQVTKDIDNKIVLLKMELQIESESIKNNINILKEDLRELKTDFKEFRNKLNEELKNMTKSLTDVNIILKTFSAKSNR